MAILDSVSNLPYIGPVYVKRLEKLSIFTIEDLLTHAPSRYLDFRRTTSIATARVGETYTIKGRVVSTTNQYTKQGRQMQIVHLVDPSGGIDLVWFNQKFILSTFKKGLDILVAGEISWFGKKKAMIAPEYEIVSQISSAVHTGRLVPVYPSTKGISSKWIRSRINDAFKIERDNIVEFLPSSILSLESLNDLPTAIKNIHFPEDDESVEKGIERLALNEFLSIYINALKRKIKWVKTINSHELKVTNEQLAKFIDSLPYKLTPSQIRSINEIVADLKKPFPMNRLLEGDVGSGKTVVAAAICYISFINGHKSALMAPTQILADQHYKTLRETLSIFGANVEEVSGSKKIKGDDNVDVYVGTHALLYNKVKVGDLGAVIIDEQHRFGVKQRAGLIRENEKGHIAPDVLTMTATPIPRTIALTMYGDLDLSTLDELPSGRKPITTWIVPNKKRDGAYKWIDDYIDQEKIQVFIVCPFIEESENELLHTVKAAMVEFENIKKIFPNRSVGVLHGKLKTNEKNRIIDDFKNKKIDILVSTPVIEVGIDIPNAAVMLIEGAERFGLAQLHQLRGRVGRGDKKSYCLLFTESYSQKTKQRLQALRESKSGFQLAELDLKLRGPGNIFGLNQSGFPELKIASWSNEKQIKMAKQIAEQAIEDTKKFSKVFDYLSKKQVVAN